eukprot:TRINITY_DN3787_c0_g1_i1.p1 TRINITY_DN3787_c0_g1~~TRINITY_DN3787_c0_g1_i1.p1  ORF type:complete len:475 (+),score=117.77 TRINITY_DN3787_c0_g1_i1:134-1426(+)
MAVMRASYLILLLVFLSLHCVFCSAHDAKDRKKAEDHQKASKKLKECKKKCFKHKNKSAAEACLKASKGEAEKIAKELYPKHSSKLREKREKCAEKEAAMDALRESFSACVATANTTSQKLACKVALKKEKHERDFSESDDDVLSLIQMAALIESGKACNSTVPEEQTACLKAAKEAAKTLGMAVRKYAKMKRLAELKAAAEAWASCKDAGSTDASCDAIAKSRFEEVSGSSDAWTSQLEAKVRKLGQALYNGEEIKLTKLKMVQVDTFTSSTNCSEAELKVTLSELFKQVNSSGKAYETILAVGCRLVQGLAEHQFLVKTPNLKEVEIELLSEQISTTMNGTSLSRRLTLSRRLGSITEVNADIAVQLDSSSGSNSDADAGSLTSGAIQLESSSGSNSNAGAGSSTTISGAMRSASTILMVVLPMVLSW